MGVKMNIEDGLYAIILNECQKLIKRHHDYHNHVHSEYIRSKARVADAPDKSIKIPEYWAEDRKFNPFYVRGNAKAIAKSIAKKISDGTYAPQDPYRKSIPKPGGGTRELTIYQIPDASVSKYFYNRLLAKNKHRFSSFSYAYRNDRNVHFAIQDIAVDLQNDARTFIAEFDFSDFFGSIDHAYLFAQLNKNGFFVSNEERVIIEAFLKGRAKGIPQGTSISLFLANLVCWKLDKSLEKVGLKFARYADDTVIWSPDYASICKSFTIIDTFSKEAGVSINAKKSDGISLLAREGLPTEISSKQNFDFLGYSIGVAKVSIRERAEARIKKQISYLLYKNLVQPLRTTPLKALVIPSNDKDKALLIAMMQIRRYLYGGLLNRDLIDYIKGRKKSLHFKGVMSFYPLLDDEEQLRKLDGWLLSTIDRCVQKRSKMLLSHKHDKRHSFPFNCRRKDIIQSYRKKRPHGKRLLEVPSFTLILKALQKGLMDAGIERVMHPESVKYDYY
jgi:RNA-directed DNA polymerase